MACERPNKKGGIALFVEGLYYKIELKSNI
jgi:hypothetical protein